jgi:bisphosphoglycerate-dependent phosphoglycerate mutase
MKGKRVMVEARERRVRSLAKQVGQLSREEQRTVRAAIGLMEGIIEGL